MLTLLGQLVTDFVTMEKCYTKFRICSIFRCFCKITGDQIAHRYSRSVLAVLKKIEKPIIDLVTHGAIEKADLSDDLEYAWFRITRDYDMSLLKLTKKLNYRS